MNNSENKDKYLYVLNIRRNAFSGDQLVGVFSSIKKAQSAVESIFSGYKKLRPNDTDVEDYSIKNWENSEEDNRYWFYVLDPNATAYFSILKIPVNAMCATVTIKKNEAEGSSAA